MGRVRGPGWGHQLAPERVFGEMASLGVRATELGPIGYLPFEPAAIREQLDRHGLRLVGGFVPLVLHEPELDTGEPRERHARVSPRAGAEVFNAAVVADEAGLPRTRSTTTPGERVARHLAEVERLVAQHGLTLALHPHAGTQVETAADVERMLELTEVGWCLDTGHLLIGGVDPADFARRHGERVVHVHLKDVDMAVARRGVVARAGACRRACSARSAQATSASTRSWTGLDGYGRWLVLEQDTALTGEEPPVGSGPVTDVRTSIEYLQSLASRGERGWRNHEATRVAVPGAGGRHVRVRGLRRW